MEIRGVLLDGNEVEVRAITKTNVQDEKVKNGA